MGFETISETEPGVQDKLMQALELHRAGSLYQAEMLYREVLRLDTTQAEALKLLGLLANQVGKPEAAIGFFRQAIALRPAEPEYHFNLATAHKSAGDLPQAITHYRQAVSLNPANVVQRANLCDALMEQGDLDEALCNNLEALRHDRNSAVAWCTLGELVGHGRHTFTAEDNQHMESLVARDVAGGRLSASDASAVWFTLAAHWEKHGDYDESFRCYRNANDLKRDLYREAKQAFDPKKHLDFIDGLIDAFTQEFFEKTRAFGDQSELPVFIVGMVRSGTSLVEQILASHFKVFGAGERKDIDAITGQFTQQLDVKERYPACMNRIGSPLAKTFAGKYVQRLAGVAARPFAWWMRCRRTFCTWA